MARRFLIPESARSRGGVRHIFCLAELEPIGNIPPAEFEALHYQNEEGPVTVAGLKSSTLR